MKTRAEGSEALWRSLDERSHPDLVRQLAAQELFPGADALTDPRTRREFLGLAGASLALAGVTGCTREPAERILPYVESPEHAVPGRPLFYATALTDRGYATGVLVESHLGRPTKVSGNPDHPASLGATDIWSEASILDLYDPQRSQVLVRSGRIRTWKDFTAELGAARDRSARDRDGRGVRLLTGRVTSPSVLDLVAGLRHDHPGARWHAFEPLSRDGVIEGARRAFSRDLVPSYHFEHADVVLALDSDFLYSEPAHLVHANAFAARRRASADVAMNRLYAVEPTPSLTGAMADHRLPLEASAIASFARAIAHRLGVFAPKGARVIDGTYRDWIEGVARDLESHRGRSLVVAGEAASPAVHALVHAMNVALDNVGRTVTFLDPGTDPKPSSIAELVEDMNAGDVDVLLMIDVNPVYSAPADLRFAEGLANVPFRVHMGLYRDETAALCDWHVPRTHELESWGDARAFDGLVTIQQPLIEPLYFGKSPAQLVAALSGESDVSDYEIVRRYWRRRHDGMDDPAFERFFRTALHAGFVEGTTFPEIEPSVSIDAATLEEPDEGDASGLEIVFRGDPTVLDGRFARNGWLQELPKPMTKLTWDNAALVSPSTAERLDLDSEDVVELRFRGRTVRAPVFVMPGQAEETVTVHLGYGRPGPGDNASVPGFDAYPLRVSDTLWHGRGLALEKTGDRYPLATTQQHFTMEGRGLVRRATLDEYRDDPHFVHEQHPPPDDDETLYPAWKYDGYAWGMVIDLSTCIGCSACVTACQAENNVPLVGKRGVLEGREMHWLRVDRYYQGGRDNPEMLHQPVPCMHCENAPCEVVCPVAATVHSDEGLNEMVYNRCVGTRYCSNNCPYKVRRFNFLDYSVDDPVVNLMRNPDVSVRSRGVMEKCTYCVQRISDARIEAKREGRSIRDGEIVTACASACPADAIVFGDVNDAESNVARLKRDPRNYGILTELNTKPRTTYLAKLTHPNPDVTDGSVG